MIPSEVKDAITKDREKMIVINRVPENTKKQFCALADRDFCGDYGMTLKYLLDRYLDDRIEWLRTMVVELNNRIDQFEKAKSKNEKEVI